MWEAGRVCQEGQWEGTGIIKENYYFFIIIILYYIIIIIKEESDRIRSAFKNDQCGSRVKEKIEQVRKISQEAAGVVQARSVEASGRAIL